MIKSSTGAKGETGGWLADWGVHDSSIHFYNDVQRDILEAHFEIDPFVFKQTAQKLAARIDRLNGGETQTFIIDTVALVLEFLLLMYCNYRCFLLPSMT